MYFLALKKSTIKKDYKKEKQCDLVYKMQVKKRKQNVGSLNLTTLKTIYNINVKQSFLFKLIPSNQLSYKIFSKVLSSIKHLSFINIRKSY